MPEGFRRVPQCDHRSEEIDFNVRTSARPRKGTESGSAGNNLVMNESADDPGSDGALIRESLEVPATFAVLFERHAGSLHRFLSKRVGSVDAEDLVGETFATAFRTRDNFDIGREDARPWLFGIATNVSHHYWRTEARRLNRDTSAAAGGPTSVDPGDDATSRVFFESQMDPIASALGQLDGPGLDVLLLVAGPGFTYEEISVALRIPVGTVRSRLSRARQQLRDILGSSGHYLGEPSGEQPLVTSEGPK